MAHALRLARHAARDGEVPVGAVVVQDGQAIGASGNASIGHLDPTGHAEVLALRAAAQARQAHRLDGATLYVTLEPCLMCCGAILNARIARLVYGAREPRTGAVVSAFETLMPAARHQHRVAITEGVLGANCAALLTRFFANRRDAQLGTRATMGRPDPSEPAS